MDRFTKKIFNSSGTWTCPAGVTRILVWGMGGGASGCGGFISSSYGRGGVGQNLQAVVLDVVPNTTYTITIGAGGAKTTSQLGNAGINTTFGALMTWSGAPNRISVIGSDSYGIFRYRTVVTASNMAAKATGGAGNQNPPLIGYPARNSLAVGPGSNSGSYYGGGGGMGGEGLGGAGGNAAASGAGSDGFDAAANTGGGGGGGGGGSVSGSQGGAGGSGQMIIMWVE